MINEYLISVWNGMKWKKSEIIYTRCYLFTRSLDDRSIETSDRWLAKFFQSLGNAWFNHFRLVGRGSRSTWENYSSNGLLSRSVSTLAERHAETTKSSVCAGCQETWKTVSDGRFPSVASGFFPCTCQSYLSVSWSSTVTTWEKIICFGQESNLVLFNFLL